MDNISTHITYEEATRSDTALKYNIKNIPNEVQLSNMKYVADTIFEPTRNHFNVPIYITSFFRSIELNSKIGSKSIKGHPEGTCIDITATVFKHITNKQIFQFIYKNLKFTQLIWEYPIDSKDITKDCSWVHITQREGFHVKQILICNNQYPTGRTMSKEELTKILNS